MCTYFKAYFYLRGCDHRGRVYVSVCACVCMALCVGDYSRVYGYTLVHIYV